MEIKDIVYGFFMALADSVPGVSGGTIAFVLGFYEKLLDSVNAIIKRDKDKFYQSYTFLIKLFIGWLIGIFLSVIFISRQFKVHSYFMGSVFIGLTICSIFFIIRNEREHLDGHKKYLVFTFIGILVVVLLSFLKRNIGGISNIDFKDLSYFEIIYLYLSGMLAISAMILPGISGSTILLILGVYIPLIDSISNLNKTFFLGVLFLALGIITGFFTTVKIVRFQFKKNRSKMIYLILGLTIGSIYSIAVGSSQGEIRLENFSAIGFLVGVLILFFLENIRNIKF